MPVSLIHWRRRYKPLPLKHDHDDADRAAVIQMIEDVLVNVKDDDDDTQSNIDKMSSRDAINKIRAEIKK